MQGAEETLVPGYRLDRYELVCPIASGGMASVWLARLRGKRGFEKLFAVKTIKTELITDPHYQAMFLDEARIASRIIHPNVAQIIELGEQEDILYIVMEYVDGDSLAKVSRLALKHGTPMPLGVVLRIVAETCAGLHAAHQLKDADGVSLGVVHRDVSPQNVLVTTDGGVKVIDFGLVKARGRSVGETGQGVVKGKIRYMAPEQVGSKQIDHRADVWAVGMCLYELLVGHVPYRDEDDVDVVKRLLSDDPLPALDAELPAPLRRILEKALVKDPAGRFDSCLQMRRAIEGAIDELELPAENEHVAEFLRDELPELASKRHGVTAKALQTSEGRIVTASHDELAPGDIAFAATEVSRRDPADESPPTVKQGAARVIEANDERGHASSSAVRPTTTARSLREQLGEEKRRGGFGIVVAAAVTIGAGAWILWPRSEPAPPSAPTAAASASASASAGVVDAAPASAPPPSASAALADPVDAAATELVDVDAATAELDAGARSGPHLRWPGQPPTPAPEPETPPPARTFNPAWSILTNPPDAAFMLGPQPTPAPTSPPAPDPAPTIQE